MRKIFSSFLILVLFMFIFTGVTFANSNDSDKDKNNVQSFTPTATLTPSKTWLEPYETEYFRVGTTSSNGPHIFYFNAGDGSAT